MRGRTRSEGSRVVAMAIVVLGHVALVALFARARERELAAQESAARAELFLIVTSAPPRREDMRPIVPAPISIAPPPPPSMPVLIEPIEADLSVISGPAPDWRGEAAVSARNTIREQTAPKHRGFAEREAPPKAPRPREFGWDSSPGRFGMAGGLPYMELGKRCVIALGFFGCAIGELPPPNGKLFDGMDDPDRERSSVPEAR